MQSVDDYHLVFLNHSCDELKKFKMSVETTNSLGHRSAQSTQTNQISTLKGNHMQLTDQRDFTILWSNLSYQIDLKRWYHWFRVRRLTSENQSDDNNEASRKKYIFHRISGEAKSRQLTAIMGPSGAGKSSLLKCLFQNKTKGTSGQILVDSRSKSKLKVCFIPQHDYLNEWLTVREDLLFVSRLTRNSETNTSEDPANVGGNFDQNNSYICQIGNNCRSSLIDHQANVSRVAGLLGLDSCLDVPIKKISGGEKKRLSIARELMSKPDILVLDEPTTGLDSLTCYKTVVVLRDLVRQSPNPIIVMVTIHQPERAVFNLFDKAYVLSKGNGVLFDGDPKDAISTIEQVSKLNMPSQNYNPASFLIELASDDSCTDARNMLIDFQRKKFNQKYDKAKLRRIVGSNSAANILRFCALDEASIVSESSLVDQAGLSPDSSNLLADKQSEKDSLSIQFQAEAKSLPRDQYYVSHQLRGFQASHTEDPIQALWNTMILTHRSWMSVIRNPALTKSRLTFHITLPLLMLVVFGNEIGSKDSCPKIGQELKISQMKKDIEDGTVSRNFDDFLAVCENISFFFILTYGLCVNVVSTASSFYPLTLNMFRKETANGLYSAGPYFIGQQIAELPMEIFFPTFSTILAYLITGQKSSLLEWRMFTIAYLVFMSTYFAQTLGYISGLILKNSISGAVIAAQTLMIPFCITSGFMVTLPRMTYWLRQLSYISIFRHYNIGFIATRYGFNVCDCDEDSISEPSKFLSPNVKHTLEYLFSQDNSSFGPGSSVTDLFDNLQNQFLKTQTYGMDINSCADVRPYVMEAIGVNDSDLLISLILSNFLIIVMRLTVFSLLKSSQIRSN